MGRLARTCSRQAMYRPLPTISIAPIQVVASGQSSPIATPSKVVQMIAL